jgi:hypothetical protein
MQIAPHADRPDQRTFINYTYSIASTSTKARAYYPLDEKEHASHETSLFFAFHYIDVKCLEILEFESALLGMEKVPLQIDCHLI